MSTTFEPTIERYLQRWRPTLRPTTVLGKRSVLRSFSAYLHQSHRDIYGFEQIQRQPHIDDWLEHILYLKSSSRNTHIRTVRLFFGDLIRWQWPEAPPPGLLIDEDLAPEENYLPRPLPPDLDRAVQKALIKADTFAAMALLLLRYTGMRIGEMRALPLNAMEHSGSDSFALRIPIGKTYSERLIPLDERTVDLLGRIIAQRGCRQKCRLPEQHRHLMMLDHFGRHLTQQSYSRIIKELTAHIDTTERIYCHRLRHSYATEMARAGMPVPALMKLLGHKTPKMTIRSVQARTLPMLPRSSMDGHRLSSAQLPKLIEAIVACLEMQRRDAHNYARSQQLRRFIKRMRKASFDLNKIL